MGLTSALNTSLGGLSLNETSIDVLGNNIANAGTNGFKASNVLFTTQLARTLSVGSRPSSSNGGTNPRQIGLGALSASIRKDFTQGSVTNSTSPSDLAIQGDGFFILDSPDGQVFWNQFLDDGRALFFDTVDVRLCVLARQHLEGRAAADDMTVVTVAVAVANQPQGIC